MAKGQVYSPADGANKRSLTNWCTRLKKHMYTVSICISNFPINFGINPWRNNSPKYRRFGYYIFTVPAGSSISDVFKLLIFTGSPSNMLQPIHSYKYQCHYFTVLGAQQTDMSVPCRSLVEIENTPWGILIL